MHRCKCIRHRLLANTTGWNRVSERECLWPGRTTAHRFLPNCSCTEAPIASPSRGCWEDWQGSGCDSVLQILCFWPQWKKWTKLHRQVNLRNHTVQRCLHQSIRSGQQTQVALMPQKFASGRRLPWKVLQLSHFGVRTTFEQAQRSLPLRCPLRFSFLLPDRLLSLWLEAGSALLRFRRSCLLSREETRRSSCSARADRLLPRPGICQVVRALESTHIWKRAKCLCEAIRKIVSELCSPENRRQLRMGCCLKILELVKF